MTDRESLVDDVRCVARAADCMADVCVGETCVEVWTEYPRSVLDVLNARDYDAYIDAKYSESAECEVTYVAVDYDSAKATRISHDVSKRKWWIRGNAPSVLCALLANNGEARTKVSDDYVCELARIATRACEKIYELSETE